MQFWKKKKRVFLKRLWSWSSGLEKSEEKIDQLQQSIIDSVAQEAAAGIQQSRPVVSKKKKNKRTQRDTSPDSSVSDASDSASSSSWGSSDGGKSAYLQLF